MKKGFIYIITNKNNSTLYTGVTSNLCQRIMDHRLKRFQNSFSAKYNLDKLVYFETFDNISDAIVREKQLKAGSRQKKLDLINAVNPDWRDLYVKICE